MFSQKEKMFTNLKKLLKFVTYKQTLLFYVLPIEVLFKVGRTIFSFQCSC